LLFASPEWLGTHNAAAGGVVPWSAVRAIQADETTTFVNGVTLHEPHIAVVVDDRAAIVGDRVDKVVVGLAQYGAYGDLTFSVRALAVDPALVLATLQFYLQHPEARVELADRRGADRVPSRRLTG
jgi:hypothetical protein